MSVFIFHIGIDSVIVSLSYQYMQWVYEESLRHICNFFIKVNPEYFIFSYHDFTTVKKNSFLSIQVWIPTCNNRGMEVYYVESSSLTFLDVSQCRGFYLKRVRTPNLLHLRIARRPWQKNLPLQQSPHLPCMCSVLSSGAPKLQYINGHRLESENLHLPSEELTSLMTIICCCLQHKRSNGIEVYGM